MSLPPLSLAAVTTFKDLSREALALLEARLDPIAISRGECLVREGEPAEALYVVVSGRFAVEVGDNPVPVAEIARGDTVGEIAFFAGGKRTATVRAIRDSVVVQLTRADFDEISVREPAIWQAITSTLAGRLASATRTAARLRDDSRTVKAGPAARTIAIVGAGPGPMSTRFLADLARLSASRSGTAVLAGSHACESIQEAQRRPVWSADALNALEMQHGLLVFITDPALTAWTQMAIRQADEVLIVGSPLSEPVGREVPLNDVEELAFKIHRPQALRIVLVHARPRVVQGTRHWLSNRPCAMHHHVAEGDADSLARLWRFTRGEARGFIACGGGAYTAAHIGVYKALKESGIDIDIYGGTSGGAAMAGAFAQGASADEVDAGVHAMFIKRRALARFTVPRYSLFDHAHFDRQLELQYGRTRIEDLWWPYFAVSTDLTRYDIEVHRTGALWQAIRASAAIPGLLPPLYTDDGRMLVDGSVISNVPIETMRAVKRGPNIVVSFRGPEHQHFSVDYSALPGRRELVWKMLLPFSGAALPEAPSAATVLVRSLMANRGRFERHLTADDWLIVPPTPDDMGALDWRMHSALAEAAYQHTRRLIAAREAATSAYGAAPA